MGVGVIKDLSENILKRGVVKGKSVCRGFEGVIAPAPPPPSVENFNLTPNIAILGRASAD